MVSLSIELRPLTEIYTILETKYTEENKDNFGIRVKPEILKEYQRINNFSGLY